MKAKELLELRRNPLQNTKNDGHDAAVKYLENVTIDSFKDELDNVSAAVDHFRVKNSVNRNIDILIHKELLARYYPNLKVQ